MKRQFLTLSIVAALAACESSDDQESGVSTPTPAEISGEVTGLATKIGNPTGMLVVNDVNPGESLVYPEEFAGTYGSFSINAAGEWEYTLYRGSADSETPEHPDVTALVKAGLPDLTESFTVKTADGTEQVITVTISGVDVPATFKGDIANTVVQRDTGKGDADGKITVSDGNPEEAFFAPIEEQNLATVYGTTTFDVTTGEWTYDLDEDNETVIALASSAESMEDTFTVKSLDGTEQVVTIVVLGSDQVPATFEPFTNISQNEDGSFAASLSVDDVSFTSSLAVLDPNYQEAAMIASGETPIDTTYGSVTVDDKGVWTYNIDYTKDGIDDMYYSEATDTPPTFSDSFTLTSVDGTEAVVAVTLQGAQLVPAVISGFPTVDVDGISSSAVNANVTSVSGMLTADDPNYGQSTFKAEALTTTYGTLTIAESGEWTYELSADTIALMNSNSLTLPASDQATVMSFDGTTQVIELSIVALEPGNFGAQVGDNNGSDGKWVIDMPETTGAVGKAAFTLRFPEDSAKDAKIVLHGSKYKPTELHRTLLALTVRGNGELRLNNETGNGKYHTLNETVEKGKPFDVEVTWDASEGTPAQMTLKINGAYVTSDAMTFNEDGSFTSMTVGAGLQTNGPDFFEIQTKGGNKMDIDDFKVYSDKSGSDLIFSESFNAEDIFEGSDITVDYISSNASANSVATGVVFPTNLGVKVGDNNGSDGKWVIDMPEATGATGRATFNLIYPEDSAKDAKIVFHGSKYKPTELHRTLLALTVRANGTLRLNNETGNGKYYTLNETVEKGKPFTVTVTWDASAGTPATMSLLIDGKSVTSDEMTFNEDGSFTSMTVGAGLQTNGPDFFEIQTKGGNNMIIDDFKVFSDVAGMNQIFSDKFNDQTQDVSVTLDYQSTNTSGNSTSVAVDFENQ